MVVITILSEIQKIGSKLYDEAKYIKVKPEVESLHNKFMLISASLNDANASLHKSDEVKEWLRQLKDLAFQAQDIIDDFVHMDAQKRRYGVVQKIVKFPNHVYNSHQLRGQIEDIKGKIKNLSDGKPKFEESQTSAEAYQLEASGDKYFPHVEFVVGFEREAEELAKLLIKEDPLGHLGVVSITGMGGLGKTTLARKVYTRDDVRRHFDCQAWVYISKEYKMRDVLYKIIEQVMVLTEPEKVALAVMEERILKERLSDFLKEKNYLFVLDDVWRSKDWDKLRGTFLVPCSGQQCRVLVTTRDESVAWYADPIAPPHKIQPLDEEKSLELFYKVVFRSPIKRDAEVSLNEEMKVLATDIVKKCDGLPLAIVVMGGLLSTRRPTIAAWRNVLDSVYWHLQSSVCHTALALSYSELPSHLKPCFLYFGFFPEDSEIQRDKLIRLWVAEGFLKPRGNLRIEDVAGECLDELMQRNLIQVAKWKSNGVPESFIIHDLLLNLAMFEAQEGNFLNISTPQNSLICYRRVALHDKCSDHEDTTASVPHPCSSSNFLRTLVCFTEIPSSLYGQFKRFKHLNVLDLEGACIESLPKEIGKLIFLKYLSLCKTSLKILPPWVGNLYNLQTLNLNSSRIHSVPIEIFKLVKLRHLLCDSMRKLESEDFIFKSANGVRHSAGRIHQLRDLQTLWFPTCSWIEGGLETLTNLRELGLTGCEGLMVTFTEALFRALVKLVCLEVLYLEEQGSLEVLLPSFSGHKYLYDITIIGCINKLPDFDNFPRNLTRLRLACVHLMEDMMVTLEKLPELKDLGLEWHPYDRSVMKCSARGFPKLENLTLLWFDWLNLWIVEEGAMCNLRTLEISYLFALKCIPEGLRHITTLQKLSLSMPRVFLEKVKEGGEDWEKIKHVPSIDTRETEIPPYLLELYERRGYLENGEIISGGYSPASFRSRCSEVLV